MRNYVLMLLLLIGLAAASDYYVGNLSTTSRLLYYQPFDSSLETYTNNFSSVAPINGVASVNRNTSAISYAPNVFGSFFDINGTFNATNVSSGVTFNTSGAYFDGIDDHVNVSSTLTNGWNALTVWVRLNASSFHASGSGDIDTIIGKANYVGCGSGDTFYMNINSVIVGQDLLTIGICNTTSYATASVPAYITGVHPSYPYLDVGMPTDVVMTWESGAPLTLWLDGVNVTNSSANLTGTIATTSSMLKIGGSNYSSEDYFNGTIERVLIQKYAMNSTQIAAMIANGTYSSSLPGTTNSSLYLNATTASTVLVSNNSQYFNFSPTNPFSISFWAKSTQTGTIWSAYDSLYGGQFLVNDTGNNIQAVFFDSAVRKLNMTVYNTNTWNLYSFVYNGTNLTGYVNSTLKNSTAAGTLLSTNRSKSMFADYYNNGHASAKNQWAGYVDEFFVYNKALLSSEVLQLYRGFNNSITLTFRDSDSLALLTNASVTIISSIIGTTTYDSGNDSSYTAFGYGDETIQVNVEVAGYQDYTQFISITELNQTLTLYLTQTTDLLARQLIVKDINTITTVQDARVQVYSNINGSAQIVSDGYTDFTGSITTYLNPIQTYNLYITKSGYSPKSISFQPTSSSYTIYIGDPFQPTYEEVSDNIVVSFEPFYTRLVSNTTYFFNISISSSQSNLDYWGVSVTHNRSTNTSTHYDFSGGRANVSILTAYNATYYLPLAVTYYYKVNDSPEYNFTKNYFVYPSNVSNNTILAAFSGLRTNMNLDDDELTPTTGIIITFGTMAVLGTITMMSGASLGAYATTIVSIVLLFFSLGNWFSFGLWALISIPIIVGSWFKVLGGDN